MKMNLTIDIDLNIDAPEKLAVALEEMAETFEQAAEAYTQSVGDLQSAWGDQGAGFWGDLAKRAKGVAGLLRKQAKACRATCSRHGIERDFPADHPVEGDLGTVPLA